MAVMLMQIPTINNHHTRFTLYCTAYNRVEWFSTFLQFSKSYTFLLIRFIFMRSIPKNLQISPSARASRARQSFPFQKIAGTLKMNIFLWKFAESTLYIKEQSPRRNFEIKSWLIFLKNYQKWPKRFLICTEETQKYVRFLFSFCF